MAFSYTFKKFEIKIHATAKRKKEEGGRKEGRFFALILALINLLSVQ